MNSAGIFNLKFQKRNTNGFSDSVFEFGIRMKAFMKRLLKVKRRNWP